MKNIYIFLGVIFLIIVTTLIIIFIPKENNNNDNNNNINIKENYNKENIIYIGDFHERLTDQENYVLTNYSDYKKIFNDDNLTEESFNNNNYILITAMYDSCSERNINISNYTIYKNNNMDVEISYEASCGVCAPQYKYYLIKTDKNITNININIKNNRTNDVQCDMFVTYKPMIYLYPEKEMNISIKLGNPNNLTTTYPKYDKEWNVLAKPNGDIIYNNRLYYGLYWEGNNDIKEDYNDGFIVNRNDLSSFLEEKLEILGLNEKEANEFIVYWLPILEKNDYNLIRFESLNTINEQMPLIINPKPDTLIRVLMAYKPLDNKIEVKEQKLIKQTRKGYTVVEWGGTLIK